MIDHPGNAEKQPQTIQGIDSQEAALVEVLRLADSYAGNKSDYQLLLTLERSRRYRVSAIAPYSTSIPSNGTGLYVVWQRTGAGK